MAPVAPSPATGGAETAAPRTTPTAAQPKKGGTLRFGSDVDINRLDPHFRIADVYYSIYDRLTQYDVNHTVQPMLAESWEVAPDFKTITFKLRKGVTFHNGRELDSAAVKFNSERARDLPNTQLDEAKWWTSIDTPDKYTVVFSSDRPRPVAFDYFEYLNIAEPSTAADPKQAVGTGPFKFVDWKQGDSFTVTRNGDYWDSGKPYLDGIVMSVVTDPQAMVTRFEAGDFDVANVPVNDFIRLKDDPRYQSYRFPNGSVAVLGPQCQTPPWDNKAARQALLYALDRNRWATTIHKGLVTPSALPWTSDSAAYDEKKSNAYQFDLDKAKSLLKEAGVTGTYTQDVMMQTGSAEFAAMAQVLQNNFAELGIKLTIKPQDTAAYLDTVNNWRYQGFWFGIGSYAHLDPTSAFTKSRAFSPTGNSSAFTTPVNARAIQVIDQATTEPDTAKRKQLFSDINDMFLDEAFALTLSAVPGKYLASAKVKDISPTLHLAQKWWQVWFDA